jgi:hypothetical protein
MLTNDAHLCGFQHCDTISKKNFPGGWVLLWRNCCFHDWPPAALPVDLLAAWKYLDGQQVQDEEFSLHGLTRIGGIDSAWQLQDLPSSLQHLDFCDEFTESLVQVQFPSGIKTLLWLSFQSKPGSHNSARRTSNLGFRK